MTRLCSRTDGCRGLRPTVVAAVLLAAAVTVAAPPHDPQMDHLLTGDVGDFPAVGDQTTPTIVAGGDGFLAVWTDDRSTILDDGDGTAGTGRDIYAARLASDGSLVDTTPFAVTRAPGDQYDPLAVWNGTDWLVVWTGTMPVESGERRAQHRGRARLRPTARCSTRSRSRSGSAATATSTWSARPATATTGAW